MPGTSPGMTETCCAGNVWLVTRPLRIVEHLEGLFELRRDRDVEPFPGRQARDEPFVVERDQIAVRAELAEGALDHRGQLRLALAEHDAGGIEIGRASCRERG